MTTKQSTAPTGVSGTDPVYSHARAWGITATVVVLYVINYSDKAILGIAAKPLRDELGLTASQIGLIGSAFFVTFAVGGLLAGPLARRVSMRWLLIAIALSWSLVMLPTVVAASFGVLLVSRMLLGFFEGPALAVVCTAIFAWHPMEKRALPSACLTASAPLTKILAAPALAAIVVHWGWRAAFLTLAGLGAAWVLLWLSTWKEGPYGAKAVAAAEAENADTAPIIKVPWLRIFLTPTFIAATLAIFSAYALSTTVLTWLPSYFEEGLGYSRLTAGSLFGVPSIAGLFFIFSTTFIADRMMAKGTSGRAMRGILPGCTLLVTCMSLLALPFLSTPAQAVAAITLGYGISNCVYALFIAGVSQLCPPSQLAGTLGLFTALMSVGGLIAPYLTGVIVDAAETKADGYLLAFQIYGVTAGIGGILAIALINPERDARRVMS
ncbi:MFS transporter [Nocardia sp. NPDC057272]|uniref:MFS transporter n=1 Tax=Nocardia sp. NPDC057272 TaxID=3346079 RepID=UPI00362B8C2A